jgi:hypothetical protein
MLGGIGSRSATRPVLIEPAGTIVARLASRAAVEQVDADAWQTIEYPEEGEAHMAETTFLQSPLHRPAP